MEATAVNPITAFQIELQMVHRILAGLILLAVGRCAWRAGTWRARFNRTGETSRLNAGYHRAISRLSLGWLGLIVIQAGLGAATVLTGKAADMATAHVLAGALSLATGAVLYVISRRNPEPVSRAPAFSRTENPAPEPGSLTAGTAAT